MELLFPELLLPTSTSIICAIWVTEGDYDGNSTTKNVHFSAPPAKFVFALSHTISHKSESHPNLLNYATYTAWQLGLQCLTCYEKKLLVVEVQSAKERGLEGAIPSRCLFHILTQLHPLKM